MGIFKETLPKFLIKQIGLRQHILSVGNNGPNQSRLNSSQFGDVKIDPGAFYTNTLNKSCTIRMSSMVDITSDELLELDLKIGNVQLEKDLVLSGLAQSYMLQGGTLLMPKGAKTPANRRGFPGKGRPLGGAYGDPLARADGKVDSFGESYGIVPMPGIESANIRTKSAYGSLREAKIEFVCHNLRQLAVMEILYMRPGFPVLLEWGWTPYVGNDGKINGSFPYISDLDQFWGRKGKKILTQSQITDLIIRFKKESGGNYDAVLGLVKNFSYTARPDGGFNCTTELMAAGEVISSIKGLNTKVASQELNVFATMPAILDFLQKAHDYVYNFGQDGSGVRDSDIKKRRYPGPDGLYDTDDDTVTEGEFFNRSPAYWEPPEYYGTSTIELWKDRRVTQNISRADVEKDFKENYLDRGQKYSLEGGLFNEDYFMHFQEGRSNWTYFWAGAGAVVAGIYAGWPGATAAYKFLLGDNAVSEGYIRLDALLYFINRSCINPTPRQPNEKITCYQTIKYNGNGTERQGNLKNRFYSPCLLNEYNHKAKSILNSAPNGVQMSQFMDTSCDPYVCLMPKQYPDVMDEKGANFVKPFSNFFGFRYADFKPNGQFHKDFDGSDVDEAKRSIGHIMLNIEFLLDVHDELHDSDDYSLGNFLKKVLEGINDACAGAHKLMLVTDNENPMITNIIDMNHPPQTPFDDIFKFNVISNDSAVRQFSFNSAVPSGMAATIAVAAGDPDNVDSLDAVTFASLNRGISNRLYRNKPPSAKGPTAEEKTQAKEKLHSELQEIYDLIHQLGDYNAKVATGAFFSKGNDAFKSKVTTTKSQMARLHELIDIVGSKDDSGFIVQNSPSSTPIPIKIDMVLDGISGMVMGQLFRINESRLPIQYRDKKVIFVCVTEDQNIDSGGNWTTKISGQMQLFPDPPKDTPWDGWVIPLNSEANDAFDEAVNGHGQTAGGLHQRECRNTPDQATYGLNGTYAAKWKVATGGTIGTKAMGPPPGNMVTAFYDSNGNEITDITAQFDETESYWVEMNAFNMPTRYYPNAQGLRVPDLPANEIYPCGQVVNVMARDNAVMPSDMIQQAEIVQFMQEEYENDFTNATAGMSCEETWEWEQMTAAKKHVQEIIDTYDDAWIKSAVSDQSIRYDIKTYGEDGGTLKRAIQAAKESGYPRILEKGYESFVQEMISVDNYVEYREFFDDVEDGKFISGYNYGVPPAIPETDDEYGYDYCASIEERRGNAGASNEDDIVY